MTTARSPRRLVRDAVRQFNKYLLNPVMLQLAGRRHFYAGAIRHVGRRSGTQYVTPIVADPTENGFLVPLPYGATTDWVRNVLGAGHATLRVHGETVEVAAPEIVAADRALLLLPPDRARYWRLVRMDRFLRLIRTPVAAEPAAAEPAAAEPAAAEPAAVRRAGGARTPRRTRAATTRAPKGSGAVRRPRRTVPTAPVEPDLRRGDPLVHDLVAEIDEAIEAGDESRVDELSARLREVAPNVGAGADT